MIPIRSQRLIDIPTVIINYYLKSGLITLAGQAVLSGVDDFKRDP